MVRFQHFLANLLHHRGIDDRDSFSLRAAKAVAGVTTWNIPSIRSAIARVKTDLYQRNTRVSRDTVLDLISSRLAQEFPSNPISPPEPNMVKILFVAANALSIAALDSGSQKPLYQRPLGLDEEFREMQSKLRASDHRNAIQLVPPRLASRPDDLIQAFNEERPQIVHFSGHGTATDELVLLSDNGGHHLVTKTAISSLFKVMKDQVQVVVLNACFSRAQAAAIVKHVDCAIGMKKEIGDTAAIKFSASFYRAIGFGHSVKDAFDQGCLGIQMYGINEETTPQLLTKRGVDPAKLRLVG